MGQSFSLAISCVAGTRGCGDDCVGQMYVRDNNRWWSLKSTDVGLLGFFAVPIALQRGCRLVVDRGLALHLPMVGRDEYFARRWIESRHSYDRRRYYSSSLKAVFLLSFVIYFVARRAALVFAFGREEGDRHLRHLSAGRFVIFLLLFFSVSGALLLFVR